MKSELPIFDESANVDNRFPQVSGKLLIQCTAFILILSLIILVPRIFVGRTDANYSTDYTKAGLANLGQALKSFEIDNDRFPSTVEGLDALVDRPPGLPYWNKYMDKLPKDGWGHPFIYICPGPDGAVFDLYSVGEDGIAGTADDIHLRELE